jgi:hypothetical protein
MTYSRALTLQRAITISRCHDVHSTNGHTKGYAAYGNVARVWERQIAIKAFMQMQNLVSPIA